MAVQINWILDAAGNKTYSQELSINGLIFIIWFQLINKVKLQVPQLKL